jgi:hypothetical protein
LWIVYRDMNAPDNAPNTWLTRRSSSGTFDPWERLAKPSLVTPGLAYAPDGKLYMLYMTIDDDHFVPHLELKLAWRLTSAGSTFTDVDQINWGSPGLLGTDPPKEERTRLQLVSLPYLTAGGVPFGDSSGYLMAYWVGGWPTTPDTFVQDKWALYRAKTPGYIAPSGACFGASIDGGSCADVVPARSTYQAQTSRPWPVYSPAVAVRWNVATAAYVQSYYDTDPPFTPYARAVGYQPWANGVAVGAPTLLRDNDDAATIQANMCTSLWALTGQTCMCTDDC